MMYLGVDIGSSSSKAVILDGDGVVRGQAVINIGTGSAGPKKVIEQALAQAGIERSDVDKTVVTGYGRMMFDGADKQITEISCHAKGVASVVPSARTIIDIGGQDAKVISIDEEGNIKNFVMNEKCAAGTGRFLEVMGRVLDTTIDGLSDMAERGEDGVTISSTCTVFAESEMISQLAAGKKIEDVALGAHKSIAERVAGLASRIGIAPEVVLSGGVALNESVIKALERELKCDIVRLESPQTMGALGAAIFARELGRNSK